MSAYIKLMEAQDKAMRKLSMFESPVMVAMRNSVHGQYERSSAVQSLVKASMPLGVNDVMKDLKAKFSPLDSQVTLAIKRAQLTETFSAIESISKASMLLDPNRDLRRKIEAITSSLSKQSAAFKVFQEQNAKIAQLFNPSISTYLRNHVRTNIDDEETINPIEAVCIKSFEEFNGVIAKDIPEQIQSKPDLIAKINDLACTYTDTYVYDQFIDKLVILIADSLGVEKSKVRIVAGLISFYWFIAMPLVSSYQQSVKDEDQDDKISWNTSRNIKQDRSINALKSENQYSGVIKASKEDLHNKLNLAIPDYEAKLLLEFKKQTISKYTLIASMFIDYLHSHTEHTDIKQVTKSDIEKFIADVQFDDLSAFKNTEIRNKVVRFLTFMKAKR